jgi:hypothetical protein
MLSLPEWRQRHLLAAWVAYWILLVLGWIGPAIPLLYRMSRAGGHGTASLSANGGVLSVSIVTIGHAFARTVSYGALTAVAIVPPLVLWLIWVAVRPRRVV